MRRLGGEEGAAMAEYGLLLAGIAVAVAAALPGFAQRIVVLFQQGLAAFP
jgi:Flp pilus assembly pilin Flp